MRRGILFFGLIGLVCTTVPAQAGDDGFTPIFDGKSLAGWDGDPKLWRVEDGTITGQTSAEDPIKVNTFLIWRQGELDDFELKCEFRMASGDKGNSGIQYRSFEVPEAGRWVIGGYQADIDATNTYTGIMYGERYRGILAHRGQKAIVGDDHKPKPAGSFGENDALKAAIRQNDWNEYHIVARGYTFRHFINGKLMSETVDEDKADRRRAGLLAFQLHVGPPMKVQFRNIRLKRLPLENGRKVVFVAGSPGEGHGENDYRAGCTLLARLLNENVPGVLAVTYHDNWPADPTAFDNADAVVLFANGAETNPVLVHRDRIAELTKRGVGLACLHEALDVPKGEAGNQLLSAIGGYFETGWSVRPVWTAEFKSLPEHPITRGVKPFTVRDEWSYHMRFVDEMKGVTPILTAVPPDETRRGPDGPYTGNPHVRQRLGQSEIVAWAYDRSAAGSKGRGFGFTGGRSHQNWTNAPFRTLVLNGIVWVAGADVPANGVPSKTPTREELEASLAAPARK
ncbi:MAG TPA: DUF1080 domain-containing protein [Phycisphaerae bacterium]|nr:DUF1080 domain-containing protein [Phycisphaerae bacterium]HPZ97915.1 DUF1080 domain-containing protein [Phycisphaerae bacterium]